MNTRSLNIILLLCTVGMLACVFSLFTTSGYVIEKIFGTLFFGVLACLFVVTHSNEVINPYVSQKNN